MMKKFTLILINRDSNDENVYYINAKNVEEIKQTIENQPYGGCDHVLALFEGHLPLLIDGTWNKQIDIIDIKDFYKDEEE